MNSYRNQLNEMKKDYFRVLSEDFPEFLWDYINTPEMQRINTTSTACGTDYTELFHHKFFYSNLDHSIGVALIVWHFTQDKKQTLAGLFHDIATPVFKHCIDFLNHDYEKQESTEELTTKMISESKEISQLLKRDHISIEEIHDYHQYPIADNDTPKLSADRLEYTFSNGLFFDSEEIWGVDQIRYFYERLTVLKNEDGIDEIGFTDPKVAEEFIHYAKDIWPFWVSNKDKITMQFIADVVKKMAEKKLICKHDLYTLSEAQIIHQIESCPDTHLTEAFRKFRNTKQIQETKYPIPDKYCINLNVKKRYVIPLVYHKGICQRIDQISSTAKEDIENYLADNQAPYVSFNFDFS